MPHTTRKLVQQHSSAEKKKDKDKKDSRGIGDGKKSEPAKSSNLCCVPKEKVACLKPEITDWTQVVRVICNSPHCNQSGYMHSECFEKFEELIAHYMSKQGRGRTWNEKQRMNNMWTHKGYDIVFKFCVCDCGHGSLKKDVDFSPPLPEPVVAAAPAPVARVAAAAPPPRPAQPPAQAVGAGAAAAALADKKKKKKEKTNLKPKLNFNPQNVSGSYFGSSRQRDDEESEAMARTQQSKRRLSSSDKSESVSGSGSAIPGLAPSPLEAAVSASLSTPTPNTSKQARKKTAASESPELEDGWVRVGQGCHSSRRGSQSGSQPPDLQSVTSRSRTSSQSSSVSSCRTEAAHQPPRTPEDTRTPVKVKQLPMFQPPPTPPAFETPSTSTLRYETGTQPPIGSGHGKQAGTDQFYGARPKFSPAFSDEVYHSDEDSPPGDRVAPISRPSPASTPNWSDLSCKSPINPDREMDDLFQQTKHFERELVTSPVLVSGADSEKRDSNGFYNCSACKTVHSSREEYITHLASEQHLWSQKMAAATDLMSIKTLQSGWETINVGCTPADIWRSPEAGFKGVSEKDYQSCKNELEKEKREKAELSQMYQQLQDQLQKEKGSKVELEENIEKLKMETLKNINEEKGKFERKILDSQKEIMEMKSVMEMLNTELVAFRCEGIQNSNTAVHKVFSQQNGDILRTDVEKLKTEISSLTQKLKKADSEKEILLRRKEETETKLKCTEEKYKAQLSTMEKKLDQLREETGNQLAKMKLRAENYEKESEERLSKSRQMEEKYSKELKDLKEKDKKMRDKLKDLEEKDKRMLEKFENSQTERKLEEAAKNTILHELEQAEEKAKKLEHSLKDANNVCEVYRITGENAEKRMKEEMRKKIIAELEVKKLTEKINTKDQISSNYEKQIDDTMKGLDNVEAVQLEIKSELSSLSKEERSANDNTDCNTVFDLFDEVLSKRKNPPKIPKLPTSEELKALQDSKPKSVDTSRGELSNIIQKSIKDDTLRNCLTSIIEDGETNGAVFEDDSDQEENTANKEDPYDTLDRFPEVGLDDEIDPYLGADKPGEFQQYLHDDCDEEEEEEDHFESSEEIIIDDNMRKTAVEKKTVCNIEKDDLSNGKLDYDEKSLEKIELKKGTQNTSALLGSLCSVDNADDMGKKMEDMTQEELRDHMRRLTSQECEDYEMRPKLKTTTEILMDLPDDYDEPMSNSRKLSSSSLLLSNSTQNDCSSLTSDSPMPESSLDSKEDRIAGLERLVLGLTDKVSSLSTKLEDTTWETGLLAKTVELVQQRNTRLSETVDSLESKNISLEKKFEESIKASGSSTEVSALKRSFLEILGSCEKFQTSFDAMSEKQECLEQKLEGTAINFEETKLENQELREEFAKLNDKFSSFKLEFEVDKSQRDSLAYSLALLTNKLPDSSVAESDSSTSGVKSDDISDTDLDKVGSLAFLDLKENVKPGYKDTRGASSSSDSAAVSSMIKSAKKSPGPVSLLTSAVEVGGAGPMLHYGGVLPPPPGPGSMPRPPAQVLTARAPLPLVYYNNGQVFSHGTGAVYPQPPMFYRYQN